MRSKTGKIYKYLALGLATIILGCSGEPKLINAKPYKIFKEQDTSIATRKRASINIISAQAKTFEERAETAIKAAFDYSNKSGVKYLDVTLEGIPEFPSSGYRYAFVKYSSDGKGVSGKETFTISAEAVTGVITTKQIEIVKDMLANSKNFQKPVKFNGKDAGTMTDDEKLTDYLIKKHNVKTEYIDKSLSVFANYKEYQIEIN